jgi:hypothetical protein
VPPNTKDVSDLVGYELQRTGPTVLFWAVFSFGLSYYNWWLLNRTHDAFPYPYAAWEPHSGPFPPLTS